MWAVYLMAFAVALVLLVCGIVVAMFFGLWLQARASGVPVSFVRMLMMRLRGVRPRLVIDSLIILAKADIEATLDEVEAHILSGGDLEAVVDALVRAEKADLAIGFRRLAAINLAGRDVVDAVRTHVEPKVLVCPPPGQGNGYVTGVCQDGIQLAATARVTVRTRLDRLVGGAGEETISARVGEGIVAAIGGTQSHKQILESPEKISAYILSRGLDSNTCFEILSVDIADVNVEENIGARLQAEQAETDKRVAQAKAEIRRAAAVAVHTEMEAKTTEMQSLVVGARAELPRGVAASLRHATFGARQPFPPTQNNRMFWMPAND